MANKNLVQFQTIQSYQIHLNSNSASILNNSSYKSDVNFYVQNLVEPNKNTLELKISLVNCQIPKSYYLINSNNNKFFITINNLTATFYFPYGNYNVYSFISQFNATCGNDFILSLNVSTNTLNISHTTYDFILSDDDNSIFGLIGFNKGISYYSSNKIIVSPFPVDFTGLKRIFLLSPSFNLNSKTSYDGSETSILSSIPVNCINNGIIYYHNNTNFKSTFNNSQLSNIQIQIIDDEGNFINFNNIDWCLTLQIDMINENIQDLNTVEDIYEQSINELL
jgi:hypothetical protein